MSMEIQKTMKKTYLDLEASEREALNSNKEKENYRKHHWGFYALKDVFYVNHNCT